MLSLDGNNCDTYSINIHFIHWFYLLDECIYNEDSVTRVLYTVQHGHQVESKTWSNTDLTTLSLDQSQYHPTRLTSLVLCLILHTLIIAVHDEMQRVERKVHVIFSRLLIYLLLYFFPLLLEALLKIAGVYPAFMRPRTILCWYYFNEQSLIRDVLVAFGSYNDLVRQVSAARNQSLVLWDFEWVLFIIRGGLILIFIFFSPYISSGDSTGSTTAQSEAAYDSVIASRPNTILALNHEPFRKFLWLKCSEDFLTHWCVLSYTETTAWVPSYYLLKG